MRVCEGAGGMRVCEGAGGHEKKRSVIRETAIN